MQSQAPLPLTEGDDVSTENRNLQPSSQRRSDSDVTSSQSDSTSIHIADPCCSTCNSAPCFCIVIDCHNPLPTCNPCSHCGGQDCKCDSPEACLIGIGATVIIGTTIGSAVYTVVQVGASFKESIPRGLLNTMLAAASGTGAWFASEGVAEVIAQAASSYVPAHIGKPIAQAWFSSIASAATTLVSSAINCKKNEQSPGRFGIFYKQRDYQAINSEPSNTLPKAPRPAHMTV